MRFHPARLAVRFPRTVLALHLAVALWAAFAARNLRSTDELLDFLPPGDADVALFQRVSDRFGALRVALVGVEAPDGEDVFSRETLGRIAQATDALKAVHGVDRVLSLTSLVDFTPSEAMVNVGPLVDPAQLPRTIEEQAALKQRVLAREHVAGSFVSPDGRAALLLVFLAAPDSSTARGISTRQVAWAVRYAARQSLAPLRIVFGGAPFATATIFEETQRDVRRLSPVAALVILAVILLSFRDPLALAVTLLSVAWATLVVLGGMATRGEPYTVVSSTLPVILFASGAGYAVHVLGRYLASGGRSAGATPGEAVLRATAIVAPPVAIAGLTTAAGFLSFLVMDIQPMRAFGVECAVGVLACLEASLVAAPAALALWPRPGVAPRTVASDGKEPRGIGAALAAVGLFATRHRWIVVGGAVALAALAIRPMLRVEVRMEPEAFFRPGSDPWLAERFLDERFGGARFLQVMVDGDMTDPATLMELERLAEYARTLPNVTQVQSLVEPLTLVNDVMGGGRRLPETKQQAINLYFFVEGEPSLRMLMTPGRDAALVHVRVRGDVAPAMAALEDYLARRLHPKADAPTANDVAERLAWAAQRWGVALDTRAAREAIGHSMAVVPVDESLRSARRAKSLALMAKGSDVAPVEFDDLRARLADELAEPGRAVENGPLYASFIASQPSPDEGKLAWRAVTEALEAIARERAIQRGLAALPPGDSDGNTAFRRDAARLLGELLPAQPILSAPRPLTAVLSGEPVLDRGLSRSVARNQEHSLLVSTVAVILLMLLLFRSAQLAFASVFPSALTMALLFGAMGLLHVRIDIGTSLVASIATGAGSDFAMHYIWYLGRMSKEEVVRFVGPIMVVSSLLVALGFAVLGLGDAQPMRLFGALAAAAMGGAALLTFLLVPALVGNVRAASPPPLPPSEN